jgi:hypothetical protein
MSQNIKNLSDKLLNKKMTRKEFMAHIALGLATLTGLNAVLNVLSSTDTRTSKSKKMPRKSNGYGGSSYGA